MGIVKDLAGEIGRATRDLEVECSADGLTARIAERDRLGDEDRPQFLLHEGDNAVLLDWTWRLPLPEGGVAALAEFVLAYVRDGIENHGWDVPILLQGGPRHGVRLTKRREDLVGRLLFARAAEAPDRRAGADVYKWHLRRSPDGAYVCQFEGSLEAEQVDRFLARGVEDTGPFVVIGDRSGE